MKKVSILLYCCIAIMTVSSCSKDDDKVSTITDAGYSSMEEVYSKFRLHPKTLTVDAATGGSFYGNSGTRYVFYANSFITASGASVAGNVEIKVCEYLKKSDMLFSKMLPLSNNEPLASGGEIAITATQNGAAVFLKPGFVFEANVPQAVNDTAIGMQFFAGRDVQDTDINKVNWEVPVRDSLQEIPGVFLMTNPSPIDTFRIISDSILSCNADRFLPWPINYQNFNVRLSIAGASVPTTRTNVRAYTFYDTFVGLWPLGVIGSYNNGTFNEMHVPDMPVHFVVFVLIDGKMYGGIKAATPLTGETYTVNLTETTAEAFKALVDAL